MRINYEKQKNRITEFMIPLFNGGEHDIDMLIDELQKAKKRGCNTMQVDRDGIWFRRYELETDEEQRIRIDKLEKLNAEWEKIHKKERYEAYLELKKEFEE